MDIQSKTETISVVQLVIQLTETEARAVLHNPAILIAAIHRAIITTDGRPATSRRVVARRSRRSARPKAVKATKTMICSTCGKVYKRPNLFQRHIQKHIAAPVDAS